MVKKKHFIKPLLALIPMSASLMINCDVVKAEDIYNDGNMTIDTDRVVGNITTTTGSKTDNLSNITATGVMSNEGNWKNSTISSAINVAVANQKGTMLNQGSIDATNMTTFVGSNTQNQDDVSVTNALVNKGNWSNSTSESSIITSTLNQEGTMLNLGTVKINGVDAKTDMSFYLPLRFVLRSRLGYTYQKAIDVFIESEQVVEKGCASQKVAEFIASVCAGKPMDPSVLGKVVR